MIKFRKPKFWFGFGQNNSEVQILCSFNTKNLMPFCYTWFCVSFPVFRTDYVQQGKLWFWANFEQIRISEYFGQHSVFADRFWTFQRSGTVWKPWFFKRQISHFDSKKVEHYETKGSSINFDPIVMLFRTRRNLRTTPKRNWIRLKILIWVIINDVTRWWRVQRFCDDNELLDIIYELPHTDIFFYFYVSSI